MAAPQCWLSLNSGLVGCGTMNDKTIPLKKGGTNRKDRLAEQLRANLQKRKAQSRSRRIGEADQRPDGLGSAKEMQKD
ncbi:hypothetical protein [Mesorhizobium sp. P5_C1]